MATQTTIVLNDFGLEEKQRTTSRGTSSRYTVTIKADPVVINLSPKEMGRGPAEAIRQHISDGIKGIGVAAKPATILARRKALDAYRAGAPWALRRYSGGRTGPKPPDPTKGRAYNDSGRLADGIFVRGSGDSWTVNVPANRFDPDTFVGGREAMIRMVTRLQELVPGLGDPAALMRDPAIREAIADTLYDAGIKQGRRNARTLAKWRRAYKSGVAGLSTALDMMRAAGLQF